MQIPIFVISLIASLCLLTALVDRSYNILEEGQFAIAVVGNRQIMCQKAVMQPCGIKLSECGDGLTYDCVAGVGIFSIKEFIGSDKESIVN